MMLLRSEGFFDIPAHVRPQVRQGQPSRKTVARIGNLVRNLIDLVPAVVIRSDERDGRVGIIS